MATLKQLLEQNFSILAHKCGKSRKKCTLISDISIVTKEWLLQKRQEHEKNTAFKDWSYRLVVNELLEELK